MDWLVSNKRSLMAQKRATVKHSDGIIIAPSAECEGLYCKAIDLEEKKAEVLARYKADPLAVADALRGESIQVKAVINTTNVLDSHDDVHFPGLWTKTLRESGNTLFLQEHKIEFNKIIADGQDLRAYVSSVSWETLGYNYDGKTQALIFLADVKYDRNPEMYYNYVKGYVRNHSVGMQYVKLALAVNDPQFEDEFAVWEKYRPQVVNGQAADERGYFWAVTEARLIEGSAVPVGSNTFTPTLSVKGVPGDHTPAEPAQVTPQDIKRLFTNILNKN